MLAALTLAFLPTPSAPPAQDAAPRPARVSAERARARAFFDARSPVVAELPTGAPLRVIEVKTPWARVQAPGGFDVWVHQDFVSWSGADGTITTRNVNMRPLPTTDAPSAPIGRLDQGEAVVRIGHEGEWFHVRAPERVSAWVLLEELEILPTFPAGWEEDWSRAAAARAPARELPPPAPEAPKPEPAKGKDAPPAGPARPASVKPESAAPVPAVGRVRAFPPAQIAKDPTRWLALAQQDLAALRNSLADSYDGWSDERSLDLETAFALVLWHGTLAADLEGARRGLAGLDALRRSYGDWLEGERQRYAEARQTLSAEVYARKLAALAQAYGDDGAGGAMVAGWLEKSGTGARPFALTRSGRSTIVHDFLGRWGDLGDYAGRELVVRGTWREDASVPGGRLLSITELRVLPAAEPR